MRVLVIGGTGLLGSHTAAEALNRGHAVTVLSRGNAELDGDRLRGVRWIKGDVARMSARDAENACSGQDAVIYALGLDDRQPHRRPAYESFRKDHVDLCLRLMRSARENGARKFVLFGSYFTHFDRLRPELGLADRHPYIRSRREQLEAVIGGSRPGFDTFVLEIPYVIASLPGKIPPWMILFDILGAMGRTAFFFPRGGTAAATASQIGAAAMGAIEGGARSAAYPIGGKNLRWVDLAGRLYSGAGRGRRLLPLPLGAFKFFVTMDSALLFLAKKERGLAMVRFAEFLYEEAFIDPEPSMLSLGYSHDDYDSTLSDMVREWSSSRGQGHRKGLEVRCGT